MVLNSPILQAVDNRYSELVEPYWFRWREMWYIIPAGWRTDGASIPRLVWPIVGHPLQGLMQAAAIPHDALYASHLVSRAEADLCFYERMRQNGINWLKAKTCYRALRVGGWHAWQQKPWALDAARRKIRVSPEIKSWGSGPDLDAPFGNEYVT